MIHRFVRHLFMKHKTFVPDVEALRGCDRCKKMVVRGMYNRLTVHLVDDHRLVEQDAYNTIDWVADRVREHRRTHPE